MSFFDNHIVLNGGKAFFAFLMLFSNGLLVFVSFKAKFLNSTCNWLITANSACIAIYSLTYFVQFGIVLFSPSGIPLWLCCLLVSVPLFAVCCQYILFPVIALDRLIGAVFPFKQMGKRYKRRFMLFALIASTSFAIFMLAASINKSIIHFSENSVLCMTSDPTPAYFTNCSWTLNICSVILYMALWVRIKLMSSSTASGEMQSNETVTRKVLFSLMTIFLVETFGWVSNWSVKLVLNQFDAGPMTQWYVLSYCSFSMQFALALYAPILYVLSSEYRSAFRLVLGIDKISPKNSIIHVVPINRSGN
ncbi:hypothetical protein niasHT_032560 [Heterodera trifolii]|uniref:G-protein coupled receptors family 1 profile domain-containing protein n=1 Tax=Heterodera trifolii TaxID=157864 RepID=A0ABD2J7G5_9BILA